MQSPELVIGLDSGCGNYEQLWSTTSLRGLVNGVLTVEVLTEGVHSGDASGVVPSSFRIARALLDRIDAADTGIVRHAAFHAQIPAERAAQAKRAAEVLGEEIWRKFPFQPGCAMQADWRTLFSRTAAVPRRHGADGLPPRRAATCCARKQAVASRACRHREGESSVRSQGDPEADPPTRAVRRRRPAVQAASPQTRIGYRKHRAPLRSLGKPAMWMGRAALSVHGMLGAQYPQAQFLHRGARRIQRAWPNEFLHMTTRNA